MRGIDVKDIPVAAGLSRATSIFSELFNKGIDDLIKDLSKRVSILP